MARKLLPVVLVNLAFLASAPAQEPEDPAREIAKIEKSLLAARKELTSGKVKLLTHTKVPERNNFQQKQEWTIWFTPDSARVDSFVPHKGKKTFLKTLCYNCERQDYFVEMMWPDPDSNPFDIKFVNADSEVKDSNNSIPNPRLLGFTPTDFVNFPNFSYTSILARKDRILFSLKKEIWRDKTPCLVMAWSRQDDTASYRVWVSPSQGYSIRCLEGNYEYPKREREELFKAHSILTTEVKKFGEVWFPQATSFTYTLNGKIQVSETVEVTEAQFNLEIPKHVFEFKGLGIPKGTAIRGFTGSENAFWDGKKIAWHKTRDIVRALPATPPSVGHPAGLAWASKALGLLALSSFFGYFFLKNKAKP